MKIALMLAVLATFLLAQTAAAQVGKSLGIIDLNTAAEADLVALPGSSADLAKAIIAHRPFESVTQVNDLLLAQKLTQEQASAIYAKAFVHINLNTATGKEILLIPGAGRKMAREFDEYRPWKSWKQFDREIGKYVGPEETARLAQYCFIPINLNTASDDDILTIPGLGPKMLKEFKEYRPWKTLEQFHKEIGKYVGEKEVKRLARFVTID